MLRTGLAIGAVLLLLGSSAMAQQGPAKACAGDIRTLCGSVQPGQGRIAACVKEHFKELSQPCQDRLAAAAAGARACAADVKEHCANVRRRGAIVACIRATLADLSDTCRAAISQVAARRR